uniref:Uncharacterized protein n=1 Tax=Candidatus Kentrum sp. SD TaxID=2126332 RepID=A0A450Z7B8_9GAMM|nr:MAG: hypothetical protein BECKSD772F_GA0070984_12144 [Candidatus Kentron sp. SD]VFK49697.1 MAG: hypothetical protein BECKSD772E_GA0070983_12174 [Candidatus Kentron sp. SD]VFK81344.1 MAG: hypothetical protein BECKSD772D_GA0070982_13191 [Candidatus Kentron sp. SD]
MDRVKISLRKESFYLNEGGAVIGDICFSVADDWYFPEKDWDDFVVRILYWITKSLISLIFKENQPQETPFMEGTFKVSIYLNEKEQCTINFIEGEKFFGDKEIIHKTTTVPFESVKSEVLKACELLLKMKESKELDFEYDYEKLKESYEMLCKCQ